MDATSDAAVIERSLEDPQAFSAIYDRHAATLFRFLIRRAGRDAADELLGETFRVAFERRSAFNSAYASARPWIYGIATNLLARHRRSEGRRLSATARLDASSSESFADAVAASIDARNLWPRIVTAVAALPDGERDALFLHAWEEMSYADIALALDIPIGTVRSRINRARGKLRELAADRGEQQAIEPNDPWKLAEERDRLMSTIDDTDVTERSAWHVPAIYARLGYEDEFAALEFLTRAFGFVERREARMGGETPDDHMLAWLEYGEHGLVMIGHVEHEVHEISSPQQTGNRTCMLNVRVDNVDVHYERSRAQGAVITMALDDAFYGERRYEALDTEGNKWHFGEPLDSVKARATA